MALESRGSGGGGAEARDEPAVRLIPLGGLGEIGLNMMLVEVDDDVIAVDCGLMFPDDELPGIDYVIPDFSYALAKREHFRAVLLTHGHEDHVGALPYLLRHTRVPVYGTALTLALVSEKLREHGLLETADLRVMRPRDRIDVGPFRVEPIRVTHSIADGIGLAIHTPAGTIVHTGDFKLDPHPLDGHVADCEKFTELGDQGVLALCSDSTNVDRPGHTRSESEVGVSLAGHFDRAAGRIILATFASHIHRLQKVLMLAAERGRRVALLGRSMERNVAVAAQLGYLEIPEGVLLPLEDLVALPRSRQVILSTGSQGETHSALALMAAAEHKYVQIERGDLVIISARVIPGNERTVGRVINALLRLGADLLYEDNAFVHVSGHASQDDLTRMMKLTRPRYFIPVHGEYRHLLGHARLAEAAGIASDHIFLIEDGTGVELTRSSARIVGKYPTGRVLVDGTGVGDIGSVVLRDRQTLAEDGVIAVAVTVDDKGAVVAGPAIASRGVIYVKENDALIDELKTAVLRALAERHGADAVDRDTAAARVRVAVRAVINQRFHRKPVVLPMIMEA